MVYNPDTNRFTDWEDHKGFVCFVCGEVVYNCECEEDEDGEKH